MCDTSHCRRDSNPKWFRTCIGDKTHQPGDTDSEWSSEEEEEEEEEMQERRCYHANWVVLCHNPVPARHA